MMTSPQVVETSVIVTSNSPSQDYAHPDDHNLRNYDMTPSWVQTIYSSFVLYTVKHLLSYPTHIFDFIYQNYRIVVTMFVDYCVVPENIHTPPTEGHWKFQGGGGFKGRNFRGEWRVHRKLLFQRVKKHEKIESNQRLIPSTK